MEIPSRHRSPPGGLPSMPSIFIGGSSPPRGRAGFGMSSSRPGFSSFAPSLSTSIPMSIPNTRNFDDAPPPLPPPRFVPVDGPVGNHAAYPEPSIRHTPSISAGSGYGSLDESVKREPGRWPPTKLERDEGYGSLSSMASSSRSQNSIPSRFGPQADKYPWKPSVDAYDNAQLSKLNSHRSLNNHSPTQRPSLIGSSLGDGLMRHSRMPSADRQQILKPLTLPTRTKPMLDSPRRLTETPVNSTALPRSTPFTPLDHMSPIEGGMDFERSPLPGTRRTDSMSVSDDATVSTQGSYELHGEDSEFPMEEMTRLRGFHIDAADHHSARPKRKASSPPGGDEPYSLPSSGDMLRRREGASRGSPTPRLSAMPHGSSISSAGGRSGSMVSNLSLQVSSLASQGSFNGAGRLSPGGMSSGGLSPTEQSSCGSPFGTPMSLTASPRSSISRATPHNRTLSDQNRQPLASPRKLSEVLNKPGTAVSKIKGFYMCECCPKKPKKFETKEDLSAHEAEKQYECSFCGNRFKNKNEAERHQNSLHVRRHSWSCSALSGWDRTFHESTIQPGQADVCGYCGKEFARSGAPGSAAGSSGGTASGSAWVATEQDWEERHRHLTDAHKYRECNASKKFYRADHFRQHLKHSHAGTSGKWTNMLENACMIEEEPPVPMSRG